MHFTHPSQLSEERLHLEHMGIAISRWGGRVGLTLLLGAYGWSLFFESTLQQFYFSYLVSFTYFLSLSLGALFFVILQHLTRAGWSVVIRRIAEITAANFPLLTVLFIPIFLGMGHLYSWAQPNAAHDALIQWKHPYLNIPFFLLRCVIYFSVWWGFSWFFLSNSVRQDQTGDVNLTVKMERVSPVAMLLFALTITFAAFDFLMSLDAHWFSTIFGVYFFSGSVVGFFALITFVTWLLQRSGRVAHIITPEHYHDLGKLLFAFVFFWGYIAFSQYMLIWYANLPEETGWLLRRQTGSWVWIGLILIFGHFLIPFLGLISRYPKRIKNILVLWAIWILIMHWFDLYWLIMPELHRQGLVFHILDLICLLGMSSLYAAGWARIAYGRSLAPMKDPRLIESLTFENA